VTNPWPYYAQTAAAAPLPAPVAEPKVMLHPFLDGKNARPDFYFDLSSPIFNPQRRYPNGQLASIPDKELDEPATHPGIRKMNIVGEGIPQWPIDLHAEPSPISGLGLGGVPSWVTPESDPDNVPPISLRDVLEATWNVLQTQISHMDWAKLNKGEEHAVSRAYTRRCKASEAVAPGEAENQASLGVKKVDFLLDRFMFRGLKPVKGGEGFENMQLVLSGNK
jgi:hypothetical protein